jgi:hypothetical protein
MFPEFERKNHSDRLKSAFQMEQTESTVLTKVCEKKKVKKLFKRFQTLLSTYKIRYSKKYYY